MIDLRVNVINNAMYASYKLTRIVGAWFWIAGAWNWFTFPEKLILKREIGYTNILYTTYNYIQHTLTSDACEFPSFLRTTWVTTRHAEITFNNTHVFPIDIGSADSSFECFKIEGTKYAIRSLPLCFIAFLTEVKDRFCYHISTSGYTGVTYNISLKGATKPKGQDYSGYGVFIKISGRFFCDYSIKIYFLFQTRGKPRTKST